MSGVVSPGPCVGGTSGEAASALSDARAVRAAFFDVDETLIAVKSMFTFLRFYLGERGESADTYQRLTDPLAAAAVAGVPREEVNRRYYRLYAGEPAARLSAAGRRWFAHEIDNRAWITGTVHAWRGHQDHQALLGLVSGSFFACTDPIAEHLAATWVDATEPGIRRGRLTGEIRQPMIGRRKGVAVTARMQSGNLTPERCAAYADHPSDLPMLRAVGCPVAVGDNPVLSDLAARHGWPRLPGPEPTHLAPNDERPRPAPQGS